MGILKLKMSDLTNDDLLNDILNSEPTTAKKGKKKAKKATTDIPIPTEEEQKKEEPKKEEIKEEQKIEEKTPETTEAPETAETTETAENAEPKEKKKKKIIIKKVVKKKDKEKDMMAEMIKQKVKEKQEFEERLLKETLERERIHKEEMELQRIEEEEIRIAEEELRKFEMERQKEFGSKNKKEIEKMNKNMAAAEEELKKQGITGGIEEMFDNLKNNAPRRNKKKKNLVKKNEEDMEKGDGEGLEVVEEKVAKEFVPTSEMESMVEKDVKFEVNENAEEIDDWENFSGNEDEESHKKDLNLNLMSDNTKKDFNHFAESEEIVETKTEKKKETKATTEEEEEPMNLRCPVICILGHVDTGKTKILDKLRRTNVQEGEAGGITQQIGATHFPIENFKHHLTKVPKEFQIEPKIPGFLIIDTPGHESFQNLRKRGQSLCDLAILVVDIMHGLQKTTLDALDMLRKRKTPFVIVFNKIDRIHNWKAEEWGGFKSSYDRQKKNQTKEFDDRYKRVCTSLIQTGLNVSLYYENPNMKEYLNIIPTSAVTGEGMPDLIAMFIYLSQKFLSKKLEFREEIQCTILEVKVLEKTGTTIDVILVNGTIKNGDKIICGGLFGPIKTTVKILMTPHPMKEMRIKSEYEHHDKISGAIGIKIFANDLDNALAGSPCYVYKTDEEAAIYAKEITQDFNSVLSGFLDKKGKGILVQASTLGSLEAILTFLNEKKIKIAAVGLGNLKKRDVTKIQIIHSKIDNPLKEHLTILAFDIKIEPEAEELAKDVNIKIFTADIIYHLFDDFIDYEKVCIDERKKDKLKEAVFPCMLQIIPGAIFNRKDPIIIGVDVKEGVLKVGTPLIVAEKKCIVGIVEGIENNKKQVNNVRAKDGSVAIRIKPHDSSLTVGRQFEEGDKLVSLITRDSINALKEFFRDDMTKDDWALIIQLKKQLEII